MKFALLGVGVAVSAALVCACTVTVDSQSQVVREEKRFTVKGPADLRVATFDGSIVIQAWDKPDILVEVEKRGSSREAVDGIEIRTEQNGAVVELEVKRPRSESFTGIGFHRGVTAKLIVSVPRQTNIHARSGDGSIQIEGVNGRLEMRTGDGSIRAKDVVGELTLSTGDGSVTVDGAEGTLDLDTGDGGVSVTGKLGAVKVHTGDGAVVLRAEHGTTMTESWEITTGDGGVTMYLPREFGAELDAYTGDGGIRNDLDLGPAGTNDVALEKSDSEPEESERAARRAGRSERSDRRTLRGRIGPGGPPLRIRTGDGAIRLRVS
jgi:hypothetical protein